MFETRRVLLCVAAVLLLDASLTFSNLWPTPFVRWDGSPSVELAVLLLALAVAAGRGVLVPPARRLAAWLAGGWLLLVLGRYVDVTAPALWGRELNFYWDLRFLPVHPGERCCSALGPRWSSRWCWRWCTQWFAGRSRR